jgi:hypothetical protein
MLEIVRLPTGPLQPFARLHGLPICYDLSLCKPLPPGRDMHARKMKSLLGSLAIMSSVMLVLSPAVAEPCHDVMIQSPAPFLGNDGEIVKLSDGSLWTVAGSYEYMYAYYPPAILCASSGRLIVRSKTLQVAPISPKSTERKSGAKIIEDTIVSDFNGLKQGNVYRLANGQLWEQVDSWIWIWIWINPSVTIYPWSNGYMMKVENIEHPVRVQLLKQ